ncbi:MAG: family 78 glycoside hydrolase catalytic domain, partial [Actinomycetes bacterium]
MGSDASWKASSQGPVTFNTIYGGEDYDARLEQAGWDSAAFDDAKWSDAVVSKGPGGVLKGLSCAASPLRTRQVFKPAKSWPNGESKTIYDFGQNAAMIPTLVTHGAAGSSIRVYTSELCQPDGPLHPIVGNSYVTYTLKGTGNETFTPRFYYMGYRYARVELRDATGGTSGALPVLDSLTSTAVSSAAEQVGDFECSSDLFNRIRTLIQWAQRNNSVSIISDCPQREKLGWLEQYHLHGPSLRYEQNYAALYTKGLSDMADSQLPSGLVPNIAPEYIVFDPDLRDSPEWGSSCVLVPWQQYEFYGDTGLLARYYDVMKRYVDYLTSRSSGGIVDHGLGDWYDMGPGGLGAAQLTPKALTATAIYYADVMVLAKTAKLLGKTADAAAFTTLAGNIYKAFNAKFHDAATGGYATGSQTANAMPLVLGLVPELQRSKVVAALVNDVRTRGYTLTAGDVGHRFLLRALADAGRSDVIFDLHSKTDTPGYGYILNRGATSLTEGWDGSESQDHFMLGHLMEWFYHDLAGIQADPAVPGFEQIVIKPTVVGDVTWAKADYQSIHGLIRNHWALIGDQMTMDVTLPAGPSATVWLPLLGSDPAKLVVTENKVAIWQNGAATGASRDVVFKRVESAS